MSDWQELELALRLVREERDRFKEALVKIQAIQPATVARFRKDGTVFKTEGGEWERVAFMVYTDLCEAETIAREALTIR